MEQKITPNLWFNGNAKEAVDYYVSIFPESTIADTAYYPASQEEGLADFQKDMAGKELTINFELAGQPFTAINAGPEFSFNPSVSFILNFDPAQDKQAREHLDELWEEFVADGEVLMSLDEYPFSQRYGWVQDRYGLSWQLILADPTGEPRPFIIPSLLFGDGMVNRAEEAINFYTSIFTDAKLGMLVRYPEESGPADKDSIMYADFMLAGQWFAAMDSATEQDYTFNEAVSFSIACQDQAEIDYFWEKLSAVPEAEQCGWCKDKFGLSWQVVPATMGELMQRPHAFARLMQMKKLVIDDF